MATGILSPPPYPPNNSSQTGNRSGTYNSFRGNYDNLPQGIWNAGSGNNNAYTRDVQPGELTSNNLNELLDENGQYIQQARSSGMEAANERGLLNSSAAAGNAQRAAIQAGLPIAQADAQANITAAGQNLDALNTILANSQNNETSRANARSAAAASRYNAELGLRNDREQRVFAGEQAGIGRSFQDYTAQMQFGNAMRLGAFQLGSQMLQNSTQFNQNLFLRAMDNPFLMADPEALQGFADFANQGTSEYYDDLFGYATNGGENLPQWQENNPWYTTPDYSQEYGDGQYVGGGPQLPYGEQPPYIPQFGGP